MGKKVAAHPHLIEKILEKGHLLGNHTYRTIISACSRGSRYLYDEISAVQELLAPFHVKTLAFRPPVGITNPKLQGVLEKLGMITVNFSCRGLDMGNRRVKGLSKRVLKHVRQGHIIALHDVMPKKDGALRYWLCEIDKILQSIKNRGLEVLPLSELMEKPVMIRTGDEKNA